MRLGAQRPQSSASCILPGRTRSGPGRHRRRLAIWKKITLSGTSSTPSKLGLPGGPGRGRDLCHGAIEMVYELEHMGLPFDRTPEGRIAQRPFGGHTNNATKQPVRRACHAADRTGHMILQNGLSAVHQEQRGLLRRVPGVGPPGELAGAGCGRGRHPYRQRQIHTSMPSRPSSRRAASGASGRSPRAYASPATA